MMMMSHHLILWSVERNPDSSETVRSYQPISWMNEWGFGMVSIRLPIGFGGGTVLSNEALGERG